MSSDHLPEPRPLRRRPALSGVVALILLAVFWAATLRQVGTLRSDDSPHSRTEGASRRLEARFRGLFETNAPGIRVLAVPMNGLLYWFGERRGAESVLVASSSSRGRVLLFTPEMELERRQLESEPVFVRNAGIIREKIATLRGLGVARVFLVPVPTKLSVELATDPSLREEARGIPGPAAELGSSTSRAGHTSETPDGHRTADAYERFAKSLDAVDGVTVVTLQQLFTSRATSREDPVFAYEDTHWTSLGLNLAAAEVVGAWLGAAPSLKKAGQVADAPGDLQRMLALPERSWFRTHPFEEDVYELHRATTEPLCPSAAFLLGTSYSSHRGQTLAGQLSQGSGCSVVDLSVPGQGAVASFPAVFGGPRERLRDATVFWEFPFRDLLDASSFVRR
jgi:hypothetical protein